MRRRKDHPYLVAGGEYVHLDGNGHVQVDDGHYLAVSQGGQAELLPEAVVLAEEEEQEALKDGHDGQHGSAHARRLGVAEGV